LPTISRWVSRQRPGFVDIDGDLRRSVVRLPIDHRRRAINAEYNVARGESDWPALAVFMYRLGARSTREGIVRDLPRLIAGVCLGLAVAAAAAIRAQERGPATEWRYFGGNKAFTRYS